MNNIKKLRSPTKLASSGLFEVPCGCYATKLNSSHYQNAFYTFLYRKKLTKAQSILEYLILFISLVAAGLLGTNALVKPSILTSLRNTQNNTANNLINNPVPPATVTSQAYYAAPSTDTSDHGSARVANGGSPGGAPYNTTEYYFREGPSDMSYAPREGQVLEDIPASSYPVALSEPYTPTHHGPGYSNVYNNEYWINYWSEVYWSNPSHYNNTYNND